MAVSESQAREPGTIVGSYRLLEVLGEGGMGRVYLAEHTKIGRKVALKMLRSEYSSNQGAVRRFFSEARLVNQINHEHIVEITDFVENPGGDNYIIMEHLRGVDLHDLRASEGVIPLSRSLDIALQVCSTLAAVHEAGVVHRDLKPDNVFLVERSGRKDFVKLLDFGVAKLGTSTRTPADLERTGAGAILGTPEYMSPEQISGKEVDLKTDIYAFGIVLFELVTGRKPFEAADFGELVIKHVTVPAPRPSRIKGVPHLIPPELDDLILQCLEKDPEERPASMREVEERIQAIVKRGATEPLTALPLSGILPGRRRSSWWAVAGGLAVAAVAGIVLAAGRGRGASRVEIAFESQPAGASVHLAGVDRPLGTTPFAAAFERGDRDQSFEFRLAGHVGAMRTVSLREGSRVMVALAERRPAAPSPAAPPTPTPVVSATPPAPAPSPPAPAARKRDTSKHNPKGGRNEKKQETPDLGATIDAFD